MSDEYLEKKIAAAAPQLAKITDPEAWMAEVRGYEPPRREVITIEPPCRDDDGQMIEKEFEAPVQVEVKGDMFYVGEKFYFFYDIEELIETVKTLGK